jgi:hypothetical protein
MLLRGLLTIWLFAGCGIGWWSGHRTTIKPQDPVPAAAEKQQETVPAPEGTAEKTIPVESASAERQPLPGDKSAELTAKPKDPQREPPIVRRARRPQFSPRDWEGIYFENLFREGLVGERPKPGAPLAARPAAKPTGDAPVAPEKVAEQPVDAAAGGWSGVVSGEVVESEVKRLLLQLEQDVTTPIKFKTDYQKVREAYSLLSMWFAIIFEYEGEVRWKQAAAMVQPACWRAAANARTDGEQAYQYARLRKEELQELVRGGSFGDAEKPIEAVDWSQVIDRVPTMLQLESSLNNLKTLTASKGDFEGGLEDILQQASVIAVIGKVLAEEEMEGGDDEDYRGLAGEMTKSAQNLLQACKLKDFDSAGKAINQIEQSCNKCHEDWR